MRRLAIAALLCLCGCAARQDFAFPDLPNLSAETVAPCPVAPPVDGSLGDLATKDAALAVEYSKCRARAATAVDAYQTAQAKLAQAKKAAK